MDWGKPYFLISNVPLLPYNLFPILGRSARPLTDRNDVQNELFPEDRTTLHAPTQLIRAGKDDRISLRS